MTPPDRAVLTRELDRVRARTLALCDLPDDALETQHSPLMSPMVWDLAHIGNYEELWLVRALGGDALRDNSFDALYDAFEHPRSGRAALPILRPSAARAYLDEVRSRTLEVLESLDFDAPGLAQSGAVYAMVLQHEHQHDETLLATRQLMAQDASPPPDAKPWDGTIDMPAASEARVAGGVVALGTNDLTAFDNERPMHEVQLAPFWIDTAPATNAVWMAFIDDDAYNTESLWSARGWAWRHEAELEHPEFWRRTTDGWERLRFGQWGEVHPYEPVQHVCWFEADAFARWAGKRLPSEQEWECAASADIDGGSRRFPWGNEEPTARHANLGQRHDGPAPVWAYPDGVSIHGVHQLVGDVWEWTSSDFEPWPGFVSHPYDEYSKVFFGGDYKVLRGGSWATDPLAVRSTFRNWDHPIRRQIFSGVRLARDDA